MPTFYLHLHECGTWISDEDGLELVDREAARVEAIKAARDVMAGEVKEGRLCLGCCIVIEDAERVEIERVHFRDTLELSGLSINGHEC